METSLLVRSALATLLVVGADSSSAQNCEDRLQNNRYRCQGSNTLVDGPVDSVCLEFKSEGGLSSEFDVDEKLGFLDPPLIFSYGCVCGPVGVSSPTFNASRKDFFCAIQATDGGLAGRVSKDGRSIVYRAWDASGESAIYQCRRDPTCTVP